MLLNSNLSVHTAEQGYEEASSPQAITLFVPIDSGFSQPIKVENRAVN